eukprot:Blabericola_migrator_1__2999@NODE_186_length_11793_cov_118_761556_g161_i0_p3_GENE_NODE_186_length_11793_cov_118_761556_g161_i0NODE_186_length_11793_cov_118_761556_g161_i0_p3_ORF_typecomplete_len779_score121_77OPT/PF03169_15/2e77OPT/PF03169_15/4_6e03DUF4191/PF13829_6/0_67_NODE_186_length_11793_cov_118_761556_g161_i019444280
MLAKAESSHLNLSVNSQRGTLASDTTSRKSQMLKSPPESHTFADDQSIARIGTASTIPVPEGALAEIDDMPFEPCRQPIFTIRAVISGTMAGGLCTFLSLYYGMRFGIYPSIQVLCAAVGFLIAKALSKIPLMGGGRFTKQENAVIQTIAIACSTASSPGFGLPSGWIGLSQRSYAIVGGLEGNRSSDVLDMTYGRTALWCFALAGFGVFLAFPFKNRYIIKEKLLFPSGTTTAFLIESLHSAKLGLSKAYLLKFLGISYVVGMLSWIYTGMTNFPILGLKAAKYKFYTDLNMGIMGLGLLIPVKISFSLLLGYVLNQGLLQPYLTNFRDGTHDGAWYNSAEIESDYLKGYAYGLFAGMLGMLAFAVLTIGHILYGMIKRCISSRRRGLAANEDRVRYSSRYHKMRIDIFTGADYPWWVTACGYVVLSIVCILILTFMMKVKWYIILVLIVIAPAFAMAVLNATGRTDQDAASSFGKLVMFPVGAMNHQSIFPSVAACHTTIAACTQSACLMQDFKTAYILGADPKAMFYAQLWGAMAGVIICPAWFVLFNKVYQGPDNTPGHPMPVPYGPIYRTLAVVASGGGFASLPRNCLLVASMFALALVILWFMNLLLPEKITRYLPDPATISVGLIAPYNGPMGFILGSLAAKLWMTWNPEGCKLLRPYTAAGCISGSGIALAFQLFMTTLGVTAPIQVTFTSAYKAPASVKIKIIASIFGILSTAVVAGTLYNWWPRLVVEAQEEKERLKLIREVSNENHHDDDDDDESIDTTVELNEKCV